MTISNPPEPISPEQTEQRAPPRAIGREPIFNRMPYGVMAILAILILVELISRFGEPNVIRPIMERGYLSIATLLSDLRGGRVIDALLPLITYQFLHGGMFHLVMNAMLLLQAGPIAEAGLSKRGSGPVRFVLFFLSCGVASGLAIAAFSANGEAEVIGSSGSISGVFAGFLWAALGLARPNQAMLKPVISAAIVFLFINVGLAWVARETNLAAIAWEGHLGGFVAGLILYPLFVRVQIVKRSPNPN
ncbi:MAG: hypothetical protein RL186_59 [Pseudomonadota bacterium]|jgi:membrane associated rhomboid family serine protease